MFALEIEAIKQVRDAHGLKNLWLMIPFVRTLDEFKKVKQLVESNGLLQGHDFKLWMMCEVPSNVILLEKFLELGIDGISIGSNDLTQLTLGVDRDNQTLAQTFDERNEAVMLSIEYVIKTCRKHNVTCSICGQAPSVYPEITEMMVKAGTTSVSVTPDMIIPTRKIIASVERRIMLNDIINR
jgi:pyruvate,water dikinase